MIDKYENWKIELFKFESVINNYNLKRIVNSLLPVILLVNSRIVF